MKNAIRTLIVATAVALAACSNRAPSADHGREQQAQVAGQGQERCGGAENCGGRQRVSPGHQVSVSDPVLADYLAIHDALANDTVEGVSDAARRLAQSSTTRLSQEGHADLGAAIARAAQGLEGADLATARNGFKALSDQMIRYRALHPAIAAQTVVMHCSMVNADWVQLTNEVSNPYYGAQMLTCGEVTRQLGQV